MLRPRPSALAGRHASSFRTLRATTMSSLRSPFTIFGSLFLFVVAIPLAFFAAITTVIALGALAVRGSVIYFELTLALIQSWIFPAPPPPVKILRGQRSGQVSPQRSRHRRSSAASSASSLSAATSPGGPRLNNKSASFVALFGSGETSRDYEGVGGWRVTDGPDEDAIWLGLNSRLELPAMTPRNHHRSHTVGAPTPRRWSPVASRARTPNWTTFEDKHAGGGYFPLHASASNPRLRSMLDLRRQSQSTVTSSANSVSSSRRTSVTIRVPGE